MPEARPGMRDIGPAGPCRLTLKGHGLSQRLVKSDLPMFGATTIAVDARVVHPRLWSSIVCFWVMNGTMTASFITCSSAWCQSVPAADCVVAAERLVDQAVVTGLL